jgi:hypothetical protein
MKGLEIQGWDINCAYITWTLNGSGGNSAIKDGQAIDAHLCGSPMYHELLTRDAVDSIKRAVNEWLLHACDPEDLLYIFQLSSHTANYVKSAAVIAHTAEEAQDLIQQTHPEFSDIWAKATITEIAPLGETGPFDPVVLAVEQW